MIELHLEEFHTSFEWQKILPEPKILFHNGWDEEEFEYSWNEEIISYNKYMERVMNSEIE